MFAAETGQSYGGNNGWGWRYCASDRLDTRFENVRNELKQAMETSAEMTLESLLDSVKFDDKGLVPAIVQDVHSGEVLMFAWMNRESLEYTVRERKACYWSRSRKELWVKGLTSGNTQEVHDVRLDCDADAILIKVTQVGGACHTGFRSCFYRTADGGRWREDGELAFDAAKVYKKSAS